MGTLQNLKKKQEGFTIIEVMIVLVIAAVILLIVFLAVPALQRNSRNTQKKNIAADIAAAVGEFSTNNNGVPLTESISSCSGTCDAKSILGLVNTNNVISTVEIKNCTQIYGVICGESDPGSDDKVFVVLGSSSSGGANCFATDPRYAAATTTPKQFAVTYRVETPDSVKSGCIASGL